MSNRRFLVLSGLSLLSLSVAWAGPALASAAPSPAPAAAPADADAPDPGEILVTARKRQENAINVPIAIASYSAKELARAGAVGLRDIAAMTPGLTFQDVNGAYAAPVIRGVAQVDQTSLQGNVGVFLDGVYLNNRTGLEFGMLELDRIEVDKGPQAAQYGRNTFEGAINYLTTQPVLGAFKGNVSAEVGNHNRQTYKGGVNVPLGDRAAIRVFGGWGKFDGTILNTRNNDYVGGYNGNYAFGGSILFKPIDRLTLKFFGAVSHVDNRAVPLYSEPTINNNCGSTTVRGGTSYRTLYCGKLPTVATTNVDENVSYGLRGTNKVFYGSAALDTDFATFTVTPSYDTASYSQLVDTTSDPNAINTTVAAFPGYSAQSFVSALTPGSTDKAIDVRMQSTESKPFTYMIGFYGYDSDMTNQTQISHQLLGQPNSQPIAYSTSGGRLLTIGRSLYGELGYRFSRQFNAHAELRWTNENQSFNGVGSQATYLGTPIVGYQSFSYFTPRFSANYAFTPDVVAYASAAKGVKTGGFNSNAFGPAPAYFKYGLEKNWTYELGIKTALMGGRLHMTADLYYIDWRGIQGQQSIPGSTLSVVTNLGDATVKGIEGTVSYNVTSRLSLTANGSIADPRYAKGYKDGDLAAACGAFTGSTVTTVGCSNDVSGNQVGRTSKFQYAVTASYTWPDLLPGLDAYLRGDYTYTSGKYTTGNDLQDQGAIKLVNARLGFTHKGVELSVWVKNLFDYQYADRVTISPSTNDGAPASGITGLRYYPGERRTFGARLDYRF